MKKIIKIVILVLIIIAATIIILNIRQRQEIRSEQQVLERTLDLSKMYILARYQTDQILMEAEKYSYEDWQRAVEDVLTIWQSVEKDALNLEKQAVTISDEAKFSLVSSVFAAEKSEITAIFDAAPAGKKIATLAKHLGVDAKHAMAILRQDQDQMTADAWNEAGDTFQKLETSATVIKDGCKVAGFVGGVVLTGGVSAVAGGSMMAQAAVVVGGTDLVLEVSDDAAKIALGNHNRVSAVIGDARKITEPAATLLNISEIPENLATGYQKFSAVMVAMEQFNSAAQEGKIVGIELPAYQPVEKFANIKKYKAPVYVSVLEPSELNVWLEEHQASQGELTPIEIAEKYGNKLAKTKVVAEEVMMETTEQPVEEVKEEISEEVNEEPSTGATKLSETEESLELIMQPVPSSNDWQATIKIALFSGAPIKIVDGKFNSSFNQSFSLGKFEGSGRITLSGSYDESSRVISGRHYREYDGTYNGEPRTIVYSGSFNQVLPDKGSEVKINFGGQVATTRLDGKGKPYTTTDEAGVAIIYLVK